MPGMYYNICAANHSIKIKGPFARIRNLLWWHKHDACKEPTGGD